MANYHRRPKGVVSLWIKTLSVTLRIHFQLSSLGQVGPFYVVVAIPKDPS